MDCRFCNCAPAVYIGLPTLFGPADLCEDCAAERADVIRLRRRHKRNRAAVEWRPDSQPAKGLSDARNQFTAPCR